MTDENNEQPAAKSLLHDLRTPINQIIGYGELLEEEATADGHENYVDDLKKIRIAARDLLTKIDSLPLDGADGNGAKAKKPEGEVASAPRVQSGEYVAPAGSGEQEEPDKPARVLVVDDVELNRSMLSRRLGKRGYDVEVAEGGAEALEMIGEKEPLRTCSRKSLPTKRSF